MFNNDMVSALKIEEISVDNISAFWDLHFKYLIDDEIITDEEDTEYFQSEDYRGVIKEHMLREIDKHHMVYFVENGVRVGAAQYNTYHSEDNKCFILDFWVFPEYRGGGMGHRCFDAIEEYTRADGAAYYEINCEKENARRFWKTLGFIDNGVDEYGMHLMIKR